jgi:hypothetical protein
MSRTEIVSHPNRSTRLGPLEIGRALPIRDRRTVGITVAPHALFPAPA